MGKNLNVQNNISNKEVVNNLLQNYLDDRNATKFPNLNSSFNFSKL